MSLTDLFNQTIDIYRTQAGPGVVTKYALLYEAVPTIIQPLVGEFYAKTGMNYGKSYKALFPMGTDIIISDRVIDQNGTKYQVTGMFPRPYGSPAVQHISVDLTEEAGASIPVET